MQTMVTIRDETTFGIGSLPFVFTLAVPTEQITVRELIRSRVFYEVQEYNARHSEFFHGLVQPNDAEKTLNGFKLSTRRELDWEKQFAIALQSFQQNGFLVLVDDRQVTDLDQMIEIRPDTSVTFLKLIPLVGG